LENIARVTLENISDYFAGNKPKNEVVYNVK
jgi:hypothetical protein